MGPDRGGGKAKRILDVVAAATGLLVLSPLLAACALLIWLGDGASPFYIAPRVGRGGATFRMVKLRTMVVHADKSGVASTAAGDPRITPLGGFVRSFKLDELMQLWNVLRGEMSLVGPRPQVPRDVVLYTEQERGLLRVTPGITDFASIVFADEGNILAEAPNPDLRYQQVIRPWKSRMGLHYVAVHTLWLDGRLVLATILNGVSRRQALHWVSSLLRRSGAEADLVAVARRDQPPAPAPPPGASEIVRERGVAMSGALP